MNKEKTVVSNRRNPARNNARQLIFAWFVCLLIASFFWLITVFGKEYNTSITFHAAFVNFPEKKLLINRLPDKITLKIRTSGFKYMLLKFNLGMDTIFIDAGELKRLQYKAGNNEQYYLLLNNQLSAFGELFGKGIEVMHIKPDTVKFRLDNLSSRILPVQLNLKSHFARQFQLKDDVEYMPRKMLVHGPASVINDLHAIETEHLEIRNIQRDTSFKMSFLNADSLRVILPSKSIIVKLKTEKFTEGQLEIPVILHNVPLGYVVKTFPRSVKVKYRVALSQFKNITDKSFVVSGDFLDKSTIKNGRIKLKIESVPPSVKQAELTQSSVEFIVRKL